MPTQTEINEAVALLQAEMQANAAKIAEFLAMPVGPTITNRVDGRYGTNFETETALVSISYYSNGRALKTRVYVSSDSPDLETPPYGPKGVSAENDLAWKVYNLAELKIMRNDLKTFVEADAELFRNLTADKAVYSRKAGCSCPCSPGFVLSNMVYFEGRRVESMNITLKSSKTYAELMERAAARAAREKFAADCMFTGL